MSSEGVSLKSLPGEREKTKLKRFDLRKKKKLYELKITKPNGPNLKLATYFENNKK